jgi:hypothetical protein
MVKPHGISIIKTGISQIFSLLATSAINKNGFDWTKGKLFISNVVLTIVE